MHLLLDTCSALGILRLRKGGRLLLFFLIATALVVIVKELIVVVAVIVATTDKALAFAICSIHPSYFPLSLLIHHMTPMLNVPLTLTTPSFINRWSNNFSLLSTMVEVLSANCIARYCSREGSTR